MKVPSRKARISSTRHTVMRSVSLIGLGKRPDLTPAHHVDFFTGMRGWIGGLAFESPIICLRRRRPVSGN